MVIDCRTDEIPGQAGDDMTVMPDLIGHLVQKHSENARDTPKFCGIASSFRIKVSEMDQSVCSIAERICNSFEAKIATGGFMG